MRAIPYNVFMNRCTTDVVRKCDASRIGCGGYLIVDDTPYFFTFEYEEWERKAFDNKILAIGDLEMQGIAVLLHLAGPYLRHHTFTLLCDNFGSVAQLNNLRIRDEATAHLVDSIHTSTSTNDVRVYIEHIAGELNTGADQASRNKLKLFFKLMRTLTRKKPVDLTHLIPSRLRSLRTAVRVRGYAAARKKVSQ